MPKTQDEWLNIAKNYEDTWNFPYCLGAIDGKHIQLQASIGSGSEYYNYKNTFSVVLVAVVDANYNFIYANVGCQGRILDGGVFQNTSFFKLLNENKLELPTPKMLNGKEKQMPYVFVADEAFPLKENILKPYPGTHKKNSAKRIFNYRLSRACRVVENVFGILTAVFEFSGSQCNLNQKKQRL